MKHFAHFGHTEFYLALGYRGDAIKSYFYQYYALARDVTINLRDGSVTSAGGSAENWVVHLIDTGAATNTGGRVRRLRDHLGDQPFFLTYGDGLSNVDIDQLLEFHQRAGKLVTLTAVHSPPRFGNLNLDDQLVRTFEEKKVGSEGWINGGYMVVERGLFDYLESDATGLEVLQQVAADGQVAAYRHNGYWQCMDTVRDRELLESQWASGNPGWRVWA